MSRFAWTDEQCEDLRRMWADGMSAGIIAERINVTRNAVLGKAHRLGLPPHDTISQKPRPPRPRKALDQQRSVQVRISVGSFARPTLAPKSVPVVDADIPHEQRKQILELGEHDCRWPIGEPGTEGFFFCGAPEANMHAGRPYCPWHAEKAKGESVRLGGYLNYAPKRVA